MTAQPWQTRVSVEEYFQIERDHPEWRYEYSDGVVTMLAGGTAGSFHDCLESRRYPAWSFTW